MPYIAIGIILYILLMVILGLTAFVFLLPALIGILILAIGNLACKSCAKKFAPIWWNVLTVVLTIISTVLLCNDIFGTADVGSLPFAILGIYGFVSLYILILPAAIRQHKEKKALKTLKKAEKAGTRMPQKPVYTQPASAKQVTPAPVHATSKATTPQRFVEEPCAYTGSSLARVRKNITVVQDVFRQYGLTFKCNLVEDCDTLQLNFELMNTKQLAAAVEKGTDFSIKANVYDARGNLLCIEEVWVEYRQLRRGYASDFFYFSSDSMGRAHSIKVYAIDPTDDFDAFDEDFEEDEDELEDEFDEEEDDIVIPPGISQIASEEYRNLVDTEPPKEFVQSAYRAYRGWDEDLRKGLRKDPANPGQKVYDWKVKETWEDYPAPDYDAVHTYCQVAFTENGRTYYYRTRNPELKVGDQVYVPFGYNAPKKIGTIVSMEEVVGHDAPFPLEKTKFIIGKVQ